MKLRATIKDFYYYYFFFKSGLVLCMLNLANWIGCQNKREKREIEVWVLEGNKMEANIKEAREGQGQIFTIRLHKESLLPTLGIKLLFKETLSKGCFSTSFITFS